MRFMFLAFVFLSVAMNSWAYQIPTNFLQKWAATKTQGQKETGRVKIFQRFTTAGGHMYSIGSITFMQYPLKEKLQFDNFVGEIPDLYGEKNWTKSVRGNSLVLEGVWKKGNRYIRYDISSIDRYMTVTMFTGRLGYLDSLLPEAKLIQENLARSKPKVSERNYLKNFLGIPEVYAAGWGDILGGLGGGGSSSGGGSSGIGGIGGGSGGGSLLFPDLTEISSSMDNLSQNFSELNQQVTIANTNLTTANQNWDKTNQQLNETTQVIDKNWSETNNQINTANQNWNNTNTELNSANQNWNNTNAQINTANQNWNNTNQIVDKNWGETNKQINTANQNWSETNKQINTANQNWADTNKIVDKNWSETNRQMERANDLAAKLADPKNAFTLAAASSAGMVFGASLANLAIDGLVTGAKFVWDLLNDTAGKKERWEKFKEARANWEKTAEVAKSLEKLLDQFISTQELLGKIESSIVPEEKERLSRENLIQHLSQRTRKLEKTKKELEAEYEEARDAKCEERLSSKIDEAEKMIASNKAIKDYLSKQNYKVYNAELFCDELKGIMGKLGEAEAALQTYRLNILNAKDQFIKESGKDREKLSDATERINDREVQLKVRDERIKNAEADLEKVLTGLKEEKERYIADCKEKRSFLENMSGKASNTCEIDYGVRYNSRDVEMKYQAMRARDRKIENARKDFEDSSKRFIHVSQDIEDSKMQSYYKWFSDLEKQQFCFTHRDNPECRQLGSIKFMGPFYVKNRAKVKLRHICGADEYSY